MVTSTEHYKGHFLSSLWPSLSICILAQKNEPQQQLA